MAGTSSPGEHSPATFRTISVIGLGYIGLPTAAMFASRGVKVIGVEISPHAIACIKAGKPHIVEPNLDVLLASVVSKGMLSATSVPEPADAFIIAVGTPCREGHTPDVSYIESAGRLIAPVLRRGNLVVLESTSPIGTTEQLGEWLAALRPDLSFPHQAGEDADVQIAYCPERVLPGKILQEIVHNDRVVGGLTPYCARRAVELYTIFVQGRCGQTHARTAEMAKLVENSYRDVNIAFANELSLICDKVGVDVWELIEIANRHPRVKILTPGPGVGGHCIAVDPWFLVHSAPEQARLIRTAREVNDHKPHVVVEKVLAAAKRHARPCIACLGLAFKANVDDLRESPAVEIVHHLVQHNTGRILVAEPYVQKLPQPLAGLPIDLVPATTAVARADIVVLLVDHDEFATIPARVLEGKTVIDTRGLWRRATTLQVYRKTA